MFFFFFFFSRSFSFLNKLEIEKLIGKKKYHRRVACHEPNEALAGEGDMRGSVVGGW